MKRWWAGPDVFTRITCVRCVKALSCNCKFVCVFVIFFSFWFLSKFLSSLPAPVPQWLLFGHSQFRGQPAGSTGRRAELQRLLTSISGSPHTPPLPCPQPPLATPDTDYRRPGLLFTKETQYSFDPPSHPEAPEEPEQQQRRQHQPRLPPAGLRGPVRWGCWHGDKPGWLPSNLQQRAPVRNTEQSLPYVTVYPGLFGTPAGEEMQQHRVSGPNESVCPE